MKFGRLKIRCRLARTSCFVVIVAIGHCLRAEVAGDGPSTVRDRFWIWAHDAHVYDNSWGLPRNGRITPVEGAHYLGVPNIIFIRYEGKPAPPFEQYAVPFRSLKRVYWSVVGADSVTSDEEREHVFRLAANMPNMVGVFMDDFFQFKDASKRQWLAGKEPAFPVYLELELANPTALTGLELSQSDSAEGEYRTADFVVEASAANSPWRPVALGTLPNTAGARVKVTLDGALRTRLRIAILNTHDKKGARSCGLSGIRLWAGDKVVSLEQVEFRATSGNAAHGPELLREESEAPAALSLDQLRKVRDDLVVNGRRLDLAVTLYTRELDQPGIRSHLEYCDVVSLWTWEAKDLAQLEENFAKYKAMFPNKRTLLGCYMWNFGALKPMPVELMKKQCEFGLRMLRDGQIEGMIFLASNICDLNLETVEWTRRWIADVGDQPLRAMD